MICCHTSAYQKRKTDVIKWTEQKKEKQIIHWETKIPLILLHISISAFSSYVCFLLNNEKKLFWPNIWVLISKYREKIKKIFLHWNVLFYSLIVCMISEKSIVILIFIHLKVMYVFFLFSKSPLSSVFSNLNMICRDVAFWCLFCLEFSELPGSLVWFLSFILQIYGLL